MWVAIIAACAALLYKCDANAQRDIGAANLRARQLDSANKALLATNDSLESAFQVETVTVRETRDRWRTLVDSVLTHDTITLTQRETLIVVRATEALGACQDALSTCMRLRSAKDSIIANREEALRVEIARRPSFFDKVRSAAIYSVGGYFIGRGTR